MLEIKVLICELGTVDRLTTGTIALSEISTLGHKARNDAVELAAFEVKRLATVSGSRITFCERREVLNSLGFRSGDLECLCVEGDVESIASLPAIIV